MQRVLSVFKVAAEDLYYSETSKHEGFTGSFRGHSVDLMEQWVWR